MLIAGFLGFCGFFILPIGIQLVKGSAADQIPDQTPDMASAPSPTDIHIEAPPPALNYVPPPD